MMRRQPGVSLVQQPTIAHNGFLPGAPRAWIRAPALLTEAWTAAAWTRGPGQGEARPHSARSAALLATWSWSVAGPVEGRVCPTAHSQVGGMEFRHGHLLFRR